MNPTPPSPRVDMHFALQGRFVPLDHGYCLFGALCRALGDLHAAPWLAVHPLKGLPTPDRWLLLDPRRASLRLRVEPSRLAELLPLAGKRLDLGTCAVQIGVPSIFPLRPAPQLFARLVTIKGFTEEQPFREALSRQLEGLGVRAAIRLGRRRIVRIAQHTVVGFETALEGVSEPDSLTLQYGGLGGRQRMGCGIFVPVVAAPAWGRPPAPPGEAIEGGEAR